MAKKWEEEVVQKTESGFHYIHKNFNVRIYIIIIISGLFIGVGNIVRVLLWESVCRFV